MKRVTTTIITILAAGSFQLGHADVHNGEPLHRAVSYADLDLTSTDGVEVLYRRLSNAADQVCSPLDGRAPARIRMYRQCVSKALSGAVQDLDLPLLSQYHRAKHGDPALLAQR